SEARGGNAAASDALLRRHRMKLRRMVAVRIDRRVSRRGGPSDIVQGTLGVANVRLPQDLRGRPSPFYPWLGAVAWNQLVDVHRRHVISRRRTVRREVDADLSMDRHSVFLLAGRLSDAGSERLIREEQQQRVRGALMKLPEKLREVLILRHLEEM